jgi:hypothetical protein
MEEELEPSVSVRPPRDRSQRVSTWIGKFLPRPDLVFACQMVLIYIVIGVSLFNLTRGGGNEQEGKLWTALLSSCLGYMLPNPKLTFRTTPAE